MEVRLYANDLDDIDTILRLLIGQKLLRYSAPSDAPILGWRFPSDDLIAEWRVWLAGAMACGLIEGGYVRLA